MFVMRIWSTKSCTCIQIDDKTLLSSESCNLINPELHRIAALQEPSYHILHTCCIYVEYLFEVIGIGSFYCNQANHMILSDFCTGRKGNYAWVLLFIQVVFVLELN